MTLLLILIIFVVLILVWVLEWKFEIKFSFLNSFLGYKNFLFLFVLNWLILIFKFNEYLFLSISSL